MEIHKVSVVNITFKKSPTNGDPFTAIRVKWGMKKNRDKGQGTRDKWARDQESWA